MKKTINNYAIVTIINTFNNADGFWANPDKRSKLKVYLPVSSAIRMNLQAIEPLGKNYSELYNEIITELQNAFLDAGKGEKKDDEFTALPEYLNEYNQAFAEKLTELINQTFDVELRTFTTKDLERYAELNGEYLTETEMDILAFFIDDPKEDKKDE